MNNPDDEAFVLNLSKWCDEQQIDKGYASCIANPKSKYYGKTAKGFRVRKEGNPPLPPYVNMRLVGHENVACKGKT